MSRSTYTSLMDAIQSNDFYEFRSILLIKGFPRGLLWLDYDLLMRGLDLNRKCIVNYLLENECCVWKPHDRTSPLHIAVAKADWHYIVDKLLCLGARVSLRNIVGDTAVHVAFKTYASAIILDTLLQSYLDETNVNISNDEGLGVLHIACTRPYLKFIKQFFLFHRTSIDSQVSLNLNSPHAGYTPLHFAVEYGKHEIVGYLLERGADLYIQDRNGSTPLHLALEYCDVKMINLICNYVTKFDNITNIRGLSHFMAACASDDSSLVEKYLERTIGDCLINDRVKDDSDYSFAGYTPLHFATIYNRVHIARLLLYCHGEVLFWAATARNHTASSLAFESKKYCMAKLFSVYCEGGDVWMKEIKKIDEKSVLRKIMTKVEDESFSSCRDFDVSEGKVECQVGSECTSEEIPLNGLDVNENLDDTLPVDDDDDDDFIADNIYSTSIVDCETSIHVTPLSTRSLFEEHGEVFLTRVNDIRKMSRRLFFNVDQNESEYSECFLNVSKFVGYLSVIRPVPILVGTLIFLFVSAIVPVI